MARPTDYTPDIVQKAKDYIYVPVAAHGDDIPTIAGLALYLQLSRETIYAWAKDPTKSEFSDIVSDILAAQENTLVQKGLKGDFNPTITKLMLSKHGYVERQDITSADKPVAPLLVRFLGDDKSDTGDTERV